MSRSQFKLKQELHFRSENSKDRGYQYGECTVYRAAPDKVIFEVSEDPRKKYLSQIRYVNPGKHDNILCITTTDDTKYLNFDSRSDMNAWRDSIGGLMKSDEISRPQSVQTRTRPRHGREERKAKTSPAAVEEMFLEMVHNDRKLEPVSLDDDSPCYENSHFNPHLEEQRVAYSDQHDIRQMQEENYQALIQEEETVDTDGELDDYEDVNEILPSQPLPLTSKVDQPQEPSGLAKKKIALLPPKGKHRQAKAPLPNPKEQNSTGCKPSVKVDCPAGKMGALPKQKSNLRPAARNNYRSTFTGPGQLQSCNESIISRPGSLSSNENGHPIHGREHPLPSYDLPYEGLDKMSVSGRNEVRGKIRPPMPPPKHTKPTAQVIPQPTAGEDKYIDANEYPLDQDGRELEANCDTKERVRTICRRDGSVSSFEVEKNVQIPSREFKVGDVCLADKDGAVVIERTNLLTYLNAGDQLLQINDIDVEHKGKDFAHICLGSVSSSHINLKILRRFYQG